MKRAELAKEFNIEAIRFEPTDYGVVEIGRAPQTLDLPVKATAELAALPSSPCLPRLFDGGH